MISPVLPLALIALAIVAGAAGAYAYLNVPARPSFTLPVSTAAAPAQTNMPGLASPNVHMEGDLQIVQITAKGIYTPDLTKAKAGIPTVIRIVTKDTFDCTSIVVIPSLRYQVRLPLSGSTEITLKAQAAGTTLIGLCGMAMYRFDIEFSA